jgi:Tol biopolymer transport system component
MSFTVVKKNVSRVALAAALLTASQIGCSSQSAGGESGLGSACEPEAVSSRSSAGERNAPPVPDNGPIAFRRARPASDVHDLYVVKPDGTEERRIATAVRLFAPSPDGKKIAFETHDGINVMGVDGTERQLIVPRRRDVDALGDELLEDKLAWAPDGRRLAFITLGAFEEQLFIVDSDGRNRRALTDTSDGPSNGFDRFDWSPDGSGVAFVGGNIDDHFPSLYFAEADTGDVRRLSTKTSWARNGFFTVDRFSWSPTAGRILLALSADNETDLYVFDPENDEFCKLANKPAGRDSGHTWSPDGTRIAFGARRQEGLPSFHVYVINRDGTDLRQLTSGESSRADMPHWSPDGRMIVFHHFGEESDFLAIVNANGTGERMLTPGRRAYWLPAIGTD